jgi:hypothetical protein
VALGIGAWFWLFWSPWGTLIRGNGYEGLLTPAAKVRERRGPWTPTKMQIDSLEQDLKEYVQVRGETFGANVIATLSKYRRNYLCMTKDGARMIYVELYSPQIVSRRTWLNGVIIDDGGRENNWSIMYFPETRTFTNAYPFDRSD